MSDWIAPEDGWYEVGCGEPRKLGDEKTAAMMRGEEASGDVAWFLAGEKGSAVVLDTVPYEGYGSVAP